MRSLHARGVAALVLFGGLLLLPASSLGAVTDDEPIDFDAIQQDREKDAKKYGVTERTGKKIEKALEFFEAEQLAEAREVLEKGSARRMNPYERAVTYRLLAQFVYAQGDAQGAIDYFQKVLDQEVLALEDENGIRFNIAQLYTSTENWQAAIDALKLWFRYVDEPNPMAYYLLAIAYFQSDQLDKALEPARQAVELSSEPREGWLQLLTALHTSNEDYKSARPVLELLVTRFPKKQYWVQLSLIYGAVDDYERSLSVQQLAYAQGLLIEDAELRRLARSYLYHEMPYRAAKVLEKGIEAEQIEADVDALQMLANSWIAAREYDRSLAPLERAAKIAEDGSLYLRLGQVYVQNEEWSKAAREFRKALDKGGLEDEGQAKLLLAISLYSDGRVASARSWFARAARHDTTRKEGNGWLQHIDRELAQAESTAEARAESEASVEKPAASPSG